MIRLGLKEQRHNLLNRLSMDIELTKEEIELGLNLGIIRYKNQKVQNN